MNSKLKYNFPIGFYNLHTDANINYQLNRLIASGGIIEDVKDIAPKIKNYVDWKQEMVKIAETSLSQGKILSAAMYYRAAEFFVPPNDPDKEVFYTKFIDLFYKAYEDAAQEKFEVPYKNSFLPGLRIHVPNLALSLFPRATRSSWL